MLLNKSFDEIDYSIIQKLLEAKIVEKQNLEYKSQTWETNDPGKREMLKDISSMANAFGGYIIIGVKEENNGQPCGINWIKTEEAETKKDWMMACCISSIEPRIPGLKVDVINVDGCGSLIKIFVPRSLRRPHMVLKDDYRFYMRHDRQISKMSIEEIREACLRTEHLQKNIQVFINERKQEIYKLVGSDTIFIMGSVPLNYADSIIDINDNNIRNFLKNPPIQTKSSFNFNFVGGEYGTHVWPKPTLMGLHIGSREDIKIELMRNGYYEAFIRLDNLTKPVTDYHRSNHNVLYSLPVIGYCISFFQSLQALKTLLGLEDTIIGFLSIYNISNYGFVEYLPENSWGTRYYEPEYYERPHLEIEPIEIHDLNDPCKIAKIFLDRIWNTFGFEADKVPYFINGIFDWKKYVSRG